MQLQTLVQDSAEVTRVIRLVPGDTYRRLGKRNTYDSTETLFLGIVTGVLSNGEQVGVTAVEIAVKDEVVYVESKVFGSSEDLMLFPVDPSEVEAIALEAEKHLARKVEEAARALERAEHKAHLGGDVITQLRSNAQAPQIEAR